MRRRMKMSAVCAVAALLLSCSAFASTDAAQCHYSTVVGGSIVLQSSPWEKSLRLRWMHESTNIYDSLKTDNKYGIEADGSLKLKNVKKDDSGEYVSEVLDKVKGSMMGKKISTVCIIDKIPKPEVTFKCPSSTSVDFTCNVNPPVHGLTFQWSEGGQRVQNYSSSSLRRRSDQPVGNSFSCTVSVSSLSQTSDAVQQTCLKPDVPGSSAEKTKLFGLDFWLMVGILAGGGGLVLVLIVATIVCCTKTSRKKRKQGEEEQELRLGWSNPQQQQQQQQPHNRHPRPHPPHPHHQQQQPAGHTGPRQPRPKQPRPRAPEHDDRYPQPSPRRPAQTTRPAVGVDDEKPPPLPQPRKKTPRV